MAKLQFDVTAKWQEVEKLRQEVEALKSALKDFNAAGDMKAFDEMNRKYAEATGKLKEYEQQMQKYQQIIEQMKLSSGIVDESRQITAELNNATDVFVEQQLKVKELDAKVRDLTKSYMDLTAEQKKGNEGSRIMTELSGTTADFNRQNEVLKQLRKSYTDNIKVEGAAADSLVALRLQLRQLTAEYDRLSQADRETNLGNNLVKQIQELNAQISAAEQATGRFQRNVGNYASSWNGLGMSVQQVARELPAMAMGFNTFFLAISNNLPMLTDEFKRASEEYKNFKKEIAAGNTNVQRVVSPWKQLLSSILSWQTALVVGITVLSMYGDEIIDWVSSLFGANTAQKRLNESLKEFNNLAGKGQAEARLLFDAVKRTEEGTQGRANAIREINKAYGEYLPYLLSEQSSLKELEAAYKVVNKALIEHAALKAQTEAINDVLEKSIDKQANALNEMRAIASSELGSDNFATEIMNTVEGLTEDFRSAGASWEKAWQGVSAKIQSEVGASKLPSDFYENLEDYVRSVYDSNEQIANIQKKFNPFFNKEQADQAIVENKKHYEEMKSQAESYLNSISADQKKLLDAGKFEGIDEETVRRYKEARANIQEATKQLQVYDSYDKQNKAAEKAAEKQAKEQKKIQEKVNNELLELQRRNQQSQIELMEEGTEKKLAQINLEYDQAIAELRKREQEWKDAQGGEITVEQKVVIHTAYINAYTKKIRSEQMLESEELEAQQKSMNEYLAEYGSFQEKRLVITEEYNQKIKEAIEKGNIGDALSETMERNKMLSDLSSEREVSIDAIEKIFGDISNLSNEAIDSLIVQLKRYKQQAIDTFDISDIEKYEEALSKLENAKLDNKFGLLSNFVPDFYKEQLRLQEEINSAEETSIALSLKKIELADELKKKEQEILDYIKKQTGQEINVDSLYTAGGLSNVMSLFSGKGIDTSNLNSMIGGLVDLKSSLSSVSSASDDAASKLSGLMSVFGKGGSGGGAASTIGLIGAIINGINDTVQGVSASIDNIKSTMDALGSDTSIDTGIGKLSAGMNMFAEASQGATNAFESLKSGNIGGVISGFTQSITAWIKGFAAIHDAKNELRIQELQDQVEALDRSYNKLGRSIEKAYSTDASKLIDQQNELLEQQKLLIQQQIMEEEDKKKTDDDRIKQWKQQIEDIDNQIKDNAEQAQEAIAGISFDTFRNNFLDTLMDMDSSAEDFAADFEKYLQRSILDSLMANKYDEKIKQLYNQWTQLGDNGLTESEVERLKKEQQAIVEQMIQDRDQLAEIFGWKNELEESAASSQEASAGGFENMSQESADELNGRFTALQMAGEELSLLAQERNAQMLVISASMESLNASFAYASGIVEDIRQRQVESLLELQQINDNTLAVVKPIQQMQKDIAEVKQNTSRI